MQGTNAEIGSMVRCAVGPDSRGELLQNWRLHGSSLKPYLAFDYDRIVVMRPNHPYSIKFEAA